MLEITAIYLKIFRLLRVYRNVFMLAGAYFALYLFDKNLESVFESVLISFLGLSLIAFGNYGINEICDAKYDKFHPDKKYRGLVQHNISKLNVFVISIVLWGAGLFCGIYLDNMPVTLSLLALIISGILYNVDPIRLKDIVYLDFIFESINNPIRLLIGWYSVAGASQLVPSSFILMYWFLGMFLMSSKRYSEMRFINKNSDRDSLIGYRKSFKYYSEEKLLICIVTSLVIFTYVFGALCFKYSIDLILFLPALIIFIIWYFSLLFDNNSVLKDPESIFKNKPFIIYNIFCLFFFLYLLTQQTGLFKWLLE